MHGKIVALIVSPDINMSTWRYIIGLGTDSTFTNRMSVPDPGLRMPFHSIAVGQTAAHTLSASSGSYSRNMRRGKYSSALAKAILTIPFDYGRSLNNEHSRDSVSDDITEHLTCVARY